MEVDPDGLEDKLLKSFERRSAKRGQTIVAMAFGE
jgi:hypothetical protein